MGRAAARLVASVVAAVVIVTTAAACGDDELSSMTAAQARDQAIAAIEDAVGALPESTLVRQPDQDVACTGLSSGDGDRVTVGVQFAVEGVVDPVAGVEALKQKWTELGYTDISGESAYPLARVEKDGLRLTFASRDGAETLGATVSCVLP